MIFLAVKDGKGYVAGSKQELVNQVAVVNIFHKKVFVDPKFGGESFELNYISKSDDSRNGYTMQEMIVDAYETIFNKLNQWGYFTK